jgi:hypothetical protein
MNMNKTFVISLLMTLMLSSIVTGLPVTAATVSGSSSSNIRPVFAWMFGYTGQYFLPNVQLGISPKQVIAEAKSISKVVGAANLTLISVVGEEPAQPPWGITNVNWSNTAQVNLLRSFVTSLKTYAANVCARLDFQEFNDTLANGRSIYTEVTNFVNLIGANCFWFDHAPNLYNIVGNYSFNHMMQEVAEQNPGIEFLLNDAVGCPATIHCQTGPSYPWVTPLQNDTWQKQTYVSPSVVAKSYDKLSPKTMEALSAIWSCTCSTAGLGMILHFDAYSQVNTEPMGLFASQKTSTENSAINLLTEEGMSGSSHYSGYSYYVMYPILGAATYNGTTSSGTANYHGTLYNSLKIGKYARNTVSDFLSEMISSQNP